MSSTLHLPAVVHFASAVPHRRILDVGVGMGSYGFLLRQFLDISQERVAREDWQLTIDGVEVFEGYRNPVWDYAYDSVHIGDAARVIDGLGRYDVIVCCDVLEHFGHADARAFIGKCLSHGSVLIATSPESHWEQGAWGGNAAEEHRSQITRDDFPGLAAVVRTGATTCYVASADGPARAVVAEAALRCPRLDAGVLDLVAAKVKRRLRRLRADASGV
jgi:hypothetical protein